MAVCIWGTPWGTRGWLASQGIGNTTIGHPAIEPPVARADEAVEVTGFGTGLATPARQCSDPAVEPAPVWMDAVAVVGPQAGEARPGSDV